MSDAKRGEAQNEAQRKAGPQAGQPRLRVDWVPTAELVPYAGNAKEHPEEQVSEIAESIKEFGFSDPVGAWHDQDGNAVIVANPTVWQRLAQHVKHPSAVHVG